MIVIEVNGNVGSIVKVRSTDGSKLAHIKYVKSDKDVVWCIKDVVQLEPPKVAEISSDMFFETPGV